jgi:hypothetical protein
MARPKSADMRRSFRVTRDIKRALKTARNGLDLASDAAVVHYALRLVETVVDAAAAGKQLAFVGHDGTVERVHLVGVQIAAHTPPVSEA